MLTENQVQLLERIVFDQYQDGCDPVGLMVWSWSPCAGLGRKAGGIVSGAVQAGLVDQEGAGQEASLAITQKGLDALLAHHKISEGDWAQARLLLKGKVKL
jgi:hypothetical protein